MSQFPQITLNNKNAHSLITTTIANNAAVTANIYASSVQESFQAQDYGFRGLSVFTTGDWTAADLTVDVSLDGSTYETVRDEFSAILRLRSIPTTGGFSAALPAAVWQAGAFPYVRLRSVNTASEVSVNQGAERTLTVVLLR